MCQQEVHALSSENLRKFDTFSKRRSRAAQQSQASLHADKGEIPSPTAPPAAASPERPGASADSSDDGTVDASQGVTMEGYELGTVLGSGGFSEVRSARERETGEKVAVKVGTNTVEHTRKMRATPAPRLTHRFTAEGSVKLLFAVHAPRRRPHR